MASPLRAADAAATPPKVTFETDAVVVSELKPNARVAVFSVTREPVLYAFRTVKRSFVRHDDDGDGRIRIEARGATSWRSVFAVVDIESGAYEVAAPPAFQLDLVPLPAGALKKNGDDHPELALDRPWLEILCVRPGKGAWRAGVHDGGKDDRDGRSDDKLVIDAERLVALGATAGPLKSFQRKDVVVVVDPYTMQVMATEVSP